MAVYGIGVKYGRWDDKSKDFLQQKKACIGWENDAKYFQEQLKKVRPGDIVFLKTFYPKEQRLTVIAIGIVTQGFENHREDLGNCIGVEWLWKGEENKTIKDHFPGRWTAIYEELNPEVINWLIEILTKNVIQSREE